jgi:hypothetical protein
MLPDDAVKSSDTVDELARDRLATLVRDALVSAYGGAEPPAITWRRIRLALKAPGAMQSDTAIAGRGREPQTAASISPRRG